MSYLIKIVLEQSIFQKQIRKVIKFAEKFEIVSQNVENNSTRFA